jgi:SEC-C motif-containing protein
MAKKAQVACPCGGGEFMSCCGRFIEQGMLPQTAEELMRSRYTAYTLDDEDYIRATWYPRTLPQGKLTATEPDVKWTGLEVRKFVAEGERATVEFIARYKIGGRAYKMHEVSRFVFEEGRWYYLDGEQQ